MNTTVSEYIKEKRKEYCNMQTKEKENKLIELGLFEKEYYTNDGEFNEEYSYFEWDEEKQQNVYYKKKALDVTDEEYEEILLLSDKKKEKKNNPVATMLGAIACFLYIIGFIVGIVGAVEYGDEFGLVFLIIVWTVYFVIGTMFLGFAEIINLLNSINSKSSSK